MARLDPRMELRLVTASLWRRRGMMLLAVAAVAIAAAVCAATFLVSRDLGSKAAHELRALGPNLVVLPAVPNADSPTRGEGAQGPAQEPPIRGFADPRFASATPELLDETLVRGRMAAAGVVGTPLLYVSATVNGVPVTLVGADLEALRRLHPTWKAPAPGARSWVGARLARRLQLSPGQRVRVASAGREHLLPLGPTLVAGGPEDEAWWLPLPAAQALATQPGRVSLAHARASGEREDVARATAALELGGGIAVRPLHALAGAEARLLDRTRRLMTLVTVAVLAAAALCAFGTLTDLALERRREVALLKALGATRRDLIRLLAAESVAVGLAGGVAGWLFGLALAQLVGHHVFRSAVAVRWEAAPVVLALSLAVAVLAALGPLRLALTVDPALALKED